MTDWRKQAIRSVSSFYGGYSPQSFVNTESQYPATCSQKCFFELTKTLYKHIYTEYLLSKNILLPYLSKSIEVRHTAYELNWHLPVSSGRWTPTGNMCCTGWCCQTGVWCRSPGRCLGLGSIFVFLKLFKRVRLYIDCPCFSSYFE